MGRAEDEEAKEEKPKGCGSPLLALLRRPAMGIEVAMDALLSPVCEGVRECVRGD